MAEFGKRAFALAALAATGLASAQSSVTIFGVGDVAYVTKTHKTGTGVVASKTVGINEGFNAGNRIGFRGTEDLGGGLRASFVIENGINITRAESAASRGTNANNHSDLLAGSPVTGDQASGTGVATNRQAYVGVGSAAMGEVRAGYQYTVLYTISTLTGYHAASEQPGGEGHENGE